MPSAERALTDLGAVEAAAAIRSGKTSCVALVEACLARIRAVDPTVAAWTHVDEAGALAAARACDTEARDGHPRGPLHGVPIGVKDIFAVAGLPMTCGAVSARLHSRPDRDATSVARVRAAGVIILGKTATTEFAFRDPAPTRNPWNTAHTPGGSSSGSAAAVAARMVPLALGTQTVGSVLRPAAYCGVVGLKPAHGFIPADGVVPLAWSLDHVGVLARSVADVALAVGVLAARAVGAADPRVPRLALAVELFERATPDLARHLRDVAARLAEAGASLAEVKLPPSFTGVHEAGQVVLEAEAAAYHERQYAAAAGDFRQGIRDLLGAGLARRAVDYVNANRARRAFRDDVIPLLGSYDALLSPTAPAPAPAGLQWTGDATLCAPWSSAGVPAITLPTGVGSDGLPQALQLVQAPDGLARLLGTAAWCERAIGFSARPAV